MNNRKLFALATGLPPFMNELNRPDFLSLICFLIEEYGRATDTDINELIKEMLTAIYKVNNLERND